VTSYGDRKKTIAGHLGHRQCEGQMTTIVCPHVRLDERGIAWVDDTNVKVIEVVLDKLAHGWSPEEIVYQHHGGLSLAQIHAALAYYYDHQAEFDAEIARQVKEYEEARARSLDSPGRQRLRSRGERA
jgi:uncharacterized protein (DUF433 family)